MPNRAETEGDKYLVDRESMEVGKKYVEQAKSEALKRAKEKGVKKGKKIKSFNFLS